ncbi:hypothetical protein [Paenibacillus aestuarii]|uniref:DUF3221 domain-containing protein n=1 Tax=Paenibacillus aestuarii TaxID=516965 RepID=A0ABW0KDQ4_9BACL|nr:hypothetical protein [Paenibacillus aestuarii]
MKRSVILLAVCLTFLIICGCSKAGSGNSHHGDDAFLNIGTIYPGDISKVDYIEIRNGTNGVLTTVSDPKEIHDLISKLTTLKLEVDRNQGERTGYLYSVKLFQNKEKKLEFTTTEAAGTYYLPNEELNNSIRDVESREHL